MVAQKIRRFCAYQDRSTAEVREKLKKYQIPDDEIETLIVRLSDENFLNDERFANNFVIGKLNAKGWGKHKIKYHLKLKGIADEIIANALENICEEDWENQLQKKIDKWTKNNELSTNTYPKLVRFLTRNGFNLSDVMRKIKCANS